MLTTAPRKMIALYIACLKWFFRLGVALWFLTLPTLSIYGALNPWREGEAVIRASGVEGTLLLVGVSVSSEMRTPAPPRGSGQRTYAAIPDSLLTGRLFVVTEELAPPPIRPAPVLDTPRFFPVLAMLWVSAGAFLLWRAFRPKDRGEPSYPVQG